MTQAIGGISRPTAGIDISLTGTGVAVTRFDGERVVVEIGSKPDDGTLPGELARLTEMAERITNLIPAGSVVCIEGTAYGSRDGKQHSRSGLWWMVVNRLAQHQCTVMSIPPTMLKKRATGKGNASKDLVLAATVRKHPDLPICTNNQADAVVLDDLAQEFNQTGGK